MRPKKPKCALLPNSFGTSELQGEADKIELTIYMGPLILFNVSVKAFTLISLMSLPLCASILELLPKS